MRIPTILMIVLLLVACGGVNETASTAEAVKQQTFEWKLVTTWPKNLPGLGTAPERLAKEVEAMSNGRLNIRIFRAGEYVPAMGVFDAVS